MHKPFMHSNTEEAESSRGPTQIHIRHAHGERIRCTGALTAEVWAVTCHAGRALIVAQASDGFLGGAAPRGGARHASIHVLGIDLAASPAC